jgi:predicted nucleotidyltransferase
MTRALDLTAAAFTVLSQVLRRELPPAVRVWAFGSRVVGGARRFSDLDLALEAAERIDPGVLARLRTTLSESDLTIKVDVVDMAAVDPDFRRIVDAQKVALEPLAVD